MLAPAGTLAWPEVRPPRVLSLSRSEAITAADLWPAIIATISSAELKECQIRRFVSGMREALQ